MRPIGHLCFALTAIFTNLSAQSPNTLFPWLSRCPARHSVLCQASLSASGSAQRQRFGFAPFPFPERSRREREGSGSGGCQGGRCLGATSSPDAADLYPPCRREPATWVGSAYPALCAFVPGLWGHLMGFLNGVGDAVRTHWHCGRTSPSSAIHLPSISEHRVFAGRPLLRSCKSSACARYWRLLKAGFVEQPIGFAVLQMHIFCGCIESSSIRFRTAIQ